MELIEGGHGDTAPTNESFSCRGNPPVVAPRRKYSLCKLFGGSRRGDRGCLDVAAIRRQGGGIFCLRRLGSADRGGFSRPQTQPRSLYTLEFGTSRQRRREFLGRSPRSPFGFVEIPPQGNRLAHQPHRLRHRNCKTHNRRSIFSPFVETIRS